MNLCVHEVLQQTGIPSVVNSLVYTPSVSRKTYIKLDSIIKNNINKVKVGVVS